MKHLYNTIKPVGKRAIVAIVNGEKNTHKITDENGNEVQIFVDTSFSWDGKVANHTQATQQILEHSFTTQNVIEAM